MKLAKEYSGPAVIRPTKNGKGWYVNLSKIGRRVYLGTTYDYAVKRAKELGLKIESPTIEIEVTAYAVKRAKELGLKIESPTIEIEVTAEMKSPTSIIECLGCEPFTDYHVKPGWICGACHHFNRWPSEKCYSCQHSRCQGLIKPVKPNARPVGAMTGLNSPRGAGAAYGLLPRKR